MWNNNNLRTTESLVEYPPTMGVTKTLQQNRSSGIPPFNGSNNNLTLESLQWNIPLQ